MNSVFCRENMNDGAALRACGFTATGEGFDTRAPDGRRYVINVTVSVRSSAIRLCVVS